MKHVLSAILAAALGAVPAQAVNLVTNGDFENGTNNFTSQYQYTSYAANNNTTEGQYTVGPDAYPWNVNYTSFGDHTTGSGSYLIVNGAPDAGAIVWQSDSIAVSPGTEFFFDAYVANVCCNANYGGLNSPPDLIFTVSLDGGAAITLGERSLDAGSTGQWIGLSTNFNSDFATHAVISLVNNNTIRFGNDFGVDDISLSTVSTVGGAVPEPRTWALFVSGFGLIGGTLRRRRVVPAIA